MQVTCNFVEDSAELRRKEIEQIGTQVPAEYDALDTISCYTELVTRLIRPAPREVFTPPKFECEPSDDEGLHLIFRRSREGESLIPFQTTRTLRFSDKPGRDGKRALFHDALLNDWGIHHFHLGTTPYSKDSRFVDRGDRLLFARVTDDALYALAVMGHADAEKRPSFTNKKLVQILHDNWPDSIASGRLIGVRKATEVSSGELGALRASGFMVTTTVADGTVYGAIGGGYLKSRSSFRAGLITDAVLEELRNVESRVRQRAESIADLIGTLGGVRPSELNLKLVHQDERVFHLVERSAPDLLIRVFAHTTGMTVSRE